MGNDSFGSVGVGGRGGHLNKTWDLFERVSLETVYLGTRICVPETDVWVTGGDI